MKKWLVFIICVLIVFSAGLIGSLSNSGTTSSEWYEINKPNITPPGFVFPIVWNILYFMIALSLFFSWTKAKKNQKKKLTKAFGSNLILNAFWSIIFFGYRQPGLAFIEILFLWATIILMISTTIKIDKKAGWLLVPYLIWVGFAAVLNFLFLI